MQKLGPKKVCGIDRKRKQNGAKMRAINRQYFEKYKKKGIQKSMRKKGAERVGIYNRTPASRRSILGRRGRDLGRGRLVQFGFRLVWSSLTRPAPGGCGGSKMAPKSSFGHPGVRFLRFGENLIEVRFLMIL